MFTKQITIPFLIVALHVGTVAAEVIYSDDFSGGATGLNGTTPDTTSNAFGGTSGATWNAGSTWSANGSFGGPTGNAWLPLNVTSGNVYTVSLDIDNDSTGSQWVSIGFSGNAADSAGMATGNFWELDTYAWSLLRNNEATTGGSPNYMRTFEGPGLVNSTEIAPGVVTPGSGFDTISVILDTRASNWTAEFQFNGNSVDTFTYGTNPTIQSVGIGGFNGAVATIDNFSVSAIPEVSSVVPLAALLGFGLLGFRRRSRP